MKAALLTIAAILLAGAASAQTDAPSAPLPRADAQFVVGWQNLHKDQPQSSYNDWLNDIVYGGAGAGWYWNDHLKTQVDVGAGTRGTHTATSSWSSTAFRLSNRRVSACANPTSRIGQQYQFFRNQWFHPHVGAGVEIARETIDGRLRSGDRRGQRDAHRRASRSRRGRRDQSTASSRAPSGKPASRPT